MLETEADINMKKLELINNRLNVRLKGISLFWNNYQEGKNLYNSKTLEKIKELGANCVRFPIVIEDLKNFNIDLVNQARKLGLYVILDNHTHKDNLIKFQEFLIANKEILKKDHVIIEAFNEPIETPWVQLKQKYCNFLNNIRSVPEYESKIFLLGCSRYSSDLDSVRNNPITNDPNIMYSFHFYTGTEQHKSYYLQVVKRALYNKFPIFVSEFGISEAHGDGNQNFIWGDIWLKFLDDNGISYVMWSCSEKEESSSFNFDSDYNFILREWITKQIRGKNEN